MIVLNKWELLDHEGRDAVEEIVGSTGDHLQRAVHQAHAVHPLDREEVHGERAGRRGVDAVGERVLGELRPDLGHVALGDQGQCAARLALDLDDLVDGPQTQVVRNSAVHEMRVFPPVLLEIGIQAADRLGQLRVTGRSLPRCEQPIRFFFLAILVVPDHHRVEQHGDGGGGGHRPGDRVVGDVRAEQVEVVLHEGETHPVAQIRGVET